MGLDIYKNKISNTETSHTIILESDETNKSKIALFEKYNSFVKEEYEEYIDYIATFEKRGLKFDDYEWVCFDKVEVFENITTKERIEITSDDCVTLLQPVKILHVISTGYERKKMVLDFYTKFLAGCWYISENTELEPDDSKDYIFTEEDLNEVKKYCNSDSEVLQWELSDNEFIYFSY